MAMLWTRASVARRRFPCRCASRSGPRVWAEAWARGFLPSLRGVGVRCGGRRWRRVWSGQYLPAADGGGEVRYGIGTGGRCMAGRQFSISVNAVAGGSRDGRAIRWVRAF